MDEDYGEDVLVRICDEGASTALSFFVQLKATDRIAQYAASDGLYYRYPISTDHLRHWNLFWEPVVFVLWDILGDIGYWETIQAPDVPITPRAGARSVRLAIPVDNRIDNEGIMRIRQRTAIRHERYERESIGASILIEHLESALGVTVSYDPQHGILIIKQPDGSAVVEVFGRLADTLELLASRSGVPPVDVVMGGVRALDQIYQAYGNGEKLIVKDISGQVIREWKTFEELMRDADRFDELQG